MKKLNSIALGITLSTAIFAPAVAEPISFSQDGYKYVFETKEQGSGRMKISGAESTTGKAFVLYVRGDKVTGFFGANHVSFSKPSSVKSELASR